MRVLVMRDGAQLNCQSLPSQAGEMAGQTISFAASAPAAVNAIKSSVNQRRDSIQLLQFISFPVGTIFPPQQFWISVLTPRFRNEGLRRLYDRSPQDAERALAMRDSGHNSAGEIVDNVNMRVVLPDNCHPWVRLWASLNDFLARGCDIEFLNCPRPAGEPMRLLQHIGYIWTKWENITASSWGIP